jgi:hypothetical protein
MKFLPFLLFAFLHLLPAQAQTKLVLENSRSGRQKEIKLGSQVRLRFDTQYEGLTVHQWGRVISLTDTTLTYVVPLRKDTATVALSQITRIGKYNGLGALALGFGAGAAAGIAAGLADRERDGERERARPTTTLLAILGATLLYRGQEAVVYPVRRVNSPDSAWRLKTAL